MSHISLLPWAFGARKNAIEEPSGETPGPGSKFSTNCWGVSPRIEIAHRLFGLPVAYKSAVKRVESGYQVSTSQKTSWALFPGGGVKSCVSPVDTIWR